MYIVFIYVYTLQQVNQSQSPTYIYIIYIQCKFYIYTVCIICFLQIIHCLLHAVHIMYRNHCVNSVFMDNVSILIAYLFLYFYQLPAHCNVVACPLFAAGDHSDGD